MSPLLHAKEIILMVLANRQMPPSCLTPDIDLPDGIILSYVKGGGAGVVTGKLYNTKSIDVAVPNFNVTFTWVK